MPDEPTPTNLTRADDEPNDLTSVAKPPPPVISRRTLLATGVAGVASLGTGSILAACASISSRSTLTPRLIRTPIAPFTYHGHSESVNSITWSPDGKQIASASADKTVQVWNAVDGSHVFTYRGHSGEVKSVSWSPDGTRIASACDEDATVQIWDVTNGGHVFTYTAHSFSVVAVAWSPDGKRIASAGSGGVYVWRADNGSRVCAYPYYPDYPDYPGSGLAVSWSPDGKRAVSSSLEVSGDAFVWDTSQGQEVYIYHSQWDLQDLVLSVAWSPDGRTIACAGGISRTLQHSVQVWDAANGNRILGYNGQYEGVNDVAWSPDSKRIASAGRNQTVQVWDATNGSGAFTYHGHSDEVSSVTWSPSGQNIASASKDHTVQVWQPQ